MKIRNILPAFALLALLLTSCDDQIMNWYKDPTQGEITTAELPLQLAEKISRYKELNSYTTFVLGVGIGMNLYMDNPAYRDIVNANFDEITIGYDMKHGAMVNSKGVINFTNVDALIAKLKEAGITVYGHTLVWHSNQNASFLNGLIAPNVIPGSSGTNIMTNGDFENGASGWGGWGGGKVSLATTTDVKLAGTSSYKIVTSATSSKEWDVQVQAPTVTIIPGHQYEISFFVKSDGVGAVRLSFGDANQMTVQYPALTADNLASTTSTSSTWKQVVYRTSTIGLPTGVTAFTAVGTSSSFRLDFGKVANMTYYIDNVTVVDLDNPNNVVVPPTYQEKTDAEKTLIIGNAMSSWISSMMTHYKADVKAWDVVNEPMNENGTLRDGSAATTANDQFYWVKYLGKDFAVTAFKLARQYGNIDDKLFINDYNLEQNLAKCDGLIEYVKYIESQNTTVDGIGTQMHISINTDTLKIDQMFKKLAASGKLIKVSELDVQVLTATPTADNLASQSKMYKYVIDSYMKNIPAAQRYGITIWGVSDAVKEHVNWIPNDAPNLWDKNLARKHAYKGVADGLAGEDVSSHFSGELQD